jgi:hypothetical protein
LRGSKDFEIYLSRELARILYLPLCIKFMNQPWTFGPQRRMKISDIPPFGKGRLGGIFVMRTSSKNLPYPLFAKEGYVRDN